MTSRLNPRRSAHFRYMRSSISAQSCDSVPPAPGWIGHDGVGRSCSPPSILFVSAASTSACRSSRPRARSAATSSPGVRPLDEHAEIVGAALQRLPQRLLVFEAPAPLHDFLRFGLVVPETGLAGALFYLGKLFVEAGAFKDASAVPPPGC